MQVSLESPSHVGPSPLAAALRKGLVLAAALLIAPAFAAPQAPARSDKTGATNKVAVTKTAKAKAVAGISQKAGKTPGRKAAATRDLAQQKPGPLADFGAQTAPADVVHVANWVSYTHNAKNKAFILIDKKLAQIYVFDPQGKLRSHGPILLGKAVGDYSVPGIGNKRISQIREDEKTTPAGRFLAQPGKNTHNDNIVWIDYNAAVSMHRMRSVSAEEHRAERMETPDPSDNRISYGCVNVPPKFYDSVLRPTVVKQGAYVYVLPETTTPQKLFGSFDVPSREKRVQVAEAPATAARKAGQ